MKKLVTVLIGLALFGSACAQGEETVEPTPTPTPVIDPDDIPTALLTLEDLGEDFEEVEDPTPTTVQIGGRVGPAGYEESVAEATSSFEEIDGTGFLTNTIYLLESEAVARAFMLAHHEAETESWMQERIGGGTTSFELLGAIDDLVGVGDELYTARLEAVVVDPEGEETERTIEYVAYRIDRLLSFVVAQDLEVGAHVRRQERRMARIVL